MNTIVGERPKAPWHLWAVGLVGLLWFAGGAYDYVQTQSRNMDYIGAAADAVGLPAEVILDYFHSYPLWADICWALGVWGSIAGGVLLLLRSRFAFHALVISLIGLAGSTLYTFIADVPPEMAGTFQIVFTILIWLSVLAMAWYARAMIKAGVLR